MVLVPYSPYQACQIQYDKMRRHMTYACVSQRLNHLAGMEIMTSDSVRFMFVTYNGCILTPPNAMSRMKTHSLERPSVKKFTDQYWSHLFQRKQKNKTSTMLARIAITRMPVNLMKARLLSTRGESAVRKLQEVMQEYRLAK